MSASPNTPAQPTVSVAPMMDWTDRHCRYFHRLLAPSALLYTEMITAAALEHGDHDRLLAFDASEQPVVLQIGGSDPALMAKAAALGGQAGYQAININVGCPSDRVQSGSFGACLMREPELVAECYQAMRAATDVDVTVKTRIGIDDLDSWEFFLGFVEPLMRAGLSELVVHARIAILNGLSPKQNRSVPPLNYERVFKLKQRYPQLRITLNGGIQSIKEIHAHLAHVDAVMIGREAYNNPYFLANIEQHFGSGRTPPDRDAIVRQMCVYAEKNLRAGSRLNHISRHMLGLFNGLPGARHWRRYLSEHAHRKNAGTEVLEAALDARASA
ncbi:MAG: tRNA dihydrouridine(20/20a) synthase DusA [Pseudomonadota bacterium]